MGAVPLSVALVAGGLAVVNPCGFPLLPAYLGFYLGADEAQLPRAGTRIAQGLLVGALMTLGFLGVFALFGLPISFGAGAVARALPWAGLVTGIALAMVGFVVMLGVEIPSPVRWYPRVWQQDRRAGAVVMFGVAYGAASLGCTLPIFLVLVGASLGGPRIPVFIAYGVGMAVVLMTLSVGIALLRDGIARFLRQLLPYMSRIGGALLLVSGAYLVYYWGRIRFGETATLADDPIVGPVTRYAAEIQGYAQHHAHTLLLSAAVVLGAAAAAALWQRHRRETSQATVGR